MSSRISGGLVEYGGKWIDKLGRSSRASPCLMRTSSIRQARAPKVYLVSDNCYCIYLTVGNRCY